MTALPEMRDVVAEARSPTMIRFGLFGFYGVGNLGNVAIQEAMIQNIRKFFPNADICGFSLNPQDTERRHNIRAFPIKRSSRPALGAAAGRQAAANADARARAGRRERVKTWLKKSPTGFALLKGLKRPYDRVEAAWSEARFCWQSYRLLRQFDVFVISGGGPLDDLWGGPWSHPYTVFKWAIMTKLARKRLLVMSVGAESIRSAWSRIFIRLALSLADYRSFRDDETLRRIQKLGLRHGNHLYPDIAFSLDFTPSPRRAMPGSALSVGISPIAYLDPRSWPMPDKDRYENYVQILARFASHLIDRNYAVCFFSTVGQMDRLAIDDVRRCLLATNGDLHDEQIVVRDVQNLPDLLAQLSAFDVVVASRLHGVILSNLVVTPVLAISYERKVDQVMESLGLSDYCLPIDDVAVEALTTRFLELEKNRDAVRGQVKARTADFRVSLGRQYESAFRPCGKG